MARITISLPDELKAQLDASAEKQGISVAKSLSTPFRSFSMLHRTQRRRLLPQLLQHRYPPSRLWIKEWPSDSPASKNTSLRWLMNRRLSVRV